MSLDELRNKLLENPDFRREYGKRNLALEISKMIVRLRIVSGVTQKQLAGLIGTKQPSVARAENGVFLPSLEYLEKIAHALGTTLIPPKFESLEQIDQASDYEETDWIGLVGSKYNYLLPKYVVATNQSASDYSYPN